MFRILWWPWQIVSDIFFHIDVCCYLLSFCLKFLFCRCLFFPWIFFALNWVLFYQITYSIIQKNISCMRVKFDLLVEESWWKILFFQRQSSHFKNCNNRCQTQTLKSDKKYIAPYYFPLPANQILHGRKKWSFELSNK